MKVIKLLAEQMRDELDDGKEYAKLSVQYKMKDKRLADTYARLAEQELNHANQLHEQAGRLIEENGSEPPPAMQIVWEWEHSRMIDCMTAIKLLLDTYRK